MWKGFNSAVTFLPWFTTKLHLSVNCSLCNKCMPYQCVIVNFSICDYIYIINCFHKGGCPPLYVQNGRAAYNTSLLTGPPPTFIRRYSVGTMVSFSCDNHNIREGSGSAICQNSGMWSEQSPICNACNEHKLSILFVFLTNTISCSCTVFQKIEVCFLSVIKRDENCFYLLASCGEPRHPTNRRVVAIAVKWSKSQWWISCG